MRDDARRLLAEENLDPAVQRKAEKTARIIAQAETIKAVAEEWLESRCPGSKCTKGGPSEETVKQLRLRLKKYVYPRIGRSPIADIKLADIRGVLTPIGRRGKHETAHRVLRYVSAYIDMPSRLNERVEIYQLTSKAQSRQLKLRGLLQ